MDRRSDELDRFKRDINLAEFAATYGFVKDKTKSSSRNISMYDPNGYRIVISLSPLGHWQYFSPHDDLDNGTIVDFVQKVTNCNLGEARKILRSWVGGPASPLLTREYKIENKKKDRQATVKYLSRFKPVTESAYLESRGIGHMVYTAPIFHGKILRGYDGAVIFPHFDEKGLCGYEVKKNGFSSFCQNGYKSLWASHISPDVVRLILAESPVEALSYYCLFHSPGNAYISASGNWAPETGELIKKILKKYSANGLTVVAAFNNDEPGERQAEKIETLVAEAGSGIEYKKDLPPTAGCDWNDVLIKQRETK